MISDFLHSISVCFGFLQIFPLLLCIFIFLPLQYLQIPYLLCKRSPKIMGNCSDQFFICRNCLTFFLHFFNYRFPHIINTFSKTCNFILSFHRYLIIQISGFQDFHLVRKFDNIGKSFPHKCKQNIYKYIPCQKNGNNKCKIIISDRTVKYWITLDCPIRETYIIGIESIIIKTYIHNCVHIFIFSLFDQFNQFRRASKINIQFTLVFNP